MRCASPDCLTPEEDIRAVLLRQRSDSSEDPTLTSLTLCEYHRTDGLSDELVMVEVDRAENTSER